MLQACRWNKGGTASVQRSVPLRRSAPGTPTRPAMLNGKVGKVEKINPDLVVRDKQGKTYSVRYEAVNAMLLNEFLKEHRKNEEQQATIAQLKSGMDALTATVREQVAQIQKVSAQLEASKPAPQVVANKP